MGMQQFRSVSERYLASRSAYFCEYLHACGENMYTVSVALTVCTQFQGKYFTSRNDPPENYFFPVC